MKIQLNWFKSPADPNNTLPGSDIPREYYSTHWGSQLHHIPLNIVQETKDCFHWDVDGGIERNINSGWTETADEAKFVAEQYLAKLILTFPKVEVLN